MTPINKSFLSIVLFALIPISLPSLFSKETKNSTSKNETSIHISVGWTAKEGEKEKFASFKRKDAWTAEVLATEENQTTEEKRTYTSSKTWGIEGEKDKVGGEANTEPREETPLHGLTLTLEKDGNATRVTEGGDDLEDAWKQTLSIDPGVKKFFGTPQEEEWEAEASTLQSVFQGQLIGSGFSISSLNGKVTFSIPTKDDGGYTFKGTSTAKLSFPGATDPIDVKMGMLGAVTIEAKTGKISSLAFTGIISGAGKEIGSWGFNQTTTWEQKKDSSSEPTATETPTGDGVTIAAKFAKDEELTRTTKVNADITVDEFSAVVNGEEQPGGPVGMEITLALTTKEIDKILEVEDSKPQKVKREIIESYLELEGTPQEIPNPLEELEGATVIIEKDGDETKVTPDEGESVKQELIDSLSLGDDFKHLLPEGAIEIGDSWAPPVKTVLKTMMGPALANAGEQASEMVDKVLDKLEVDLSCQLSSVDSETGIATINMTLDLSLELTQDDLPQTGMPPGTEMEIGIEANVAGTMEYDLKWGKPLKWNFEGPLTFGQNQNMSMQFGDQEMSIQSTIKVSGNISIEQTTAKGRKE